MYDTLRAKTNILTHIHTRTHPFLHSLDIRRREQAHLATTLPLPPVLVRAIEDSDNFALEDKHRARMGAQHEYSKNESREGNMNQRITQGNLAETKLSRLLRLKRILRLHGLWNEPTNHGATKQPFVKERPRQGVQTEEQRQESGREREQRRGSHLWGMQSQGRYLLIG